MRKAHSRKTWSSRRCLRVVVRSFEHVLATAGFVLIVYHLCFHYSCITSYSMKPTLQGTSLDNGDRILTERISYWFREPRRWEIMTLRRSDGLVVMKRVVALPGEELQVLRGGEVIINGSQVRPPPELAFLKYVPVANLMSGKVFKCEDGYFVLGDYALDSDDSRFNGTIGRDEIIGRAWVILGPKGRRGWVTPNIVSGS